jgi:hypothetical protein
LNFVTFVVSKKIPGKEKRSSERIPHLEPFFPLVLEPGQPARLRRVGHVAHAKRLEHDAADTYAYIRIVMRKFSSKCTTGDKKKEKAASPS